MSVAHATAQGDQMSSSQIEALNTLLKAENTAMAAYDLGIRSVKDSSILPTLEQCRYSHSLSSERLKKRVEDLGGKPSDRTVLASILAQLSDTGAGALGDEAIISVLVGIEAFNLQQYRWHMKSLDLESWSAVHKDMFAAQEGTYRAITLLNSTFHPPE